MLTLTEALDREDVVSDCFEEKNNPQHRSDIPFPIVAHVIFNEGRAILNSYGYNESCCHCPYLSELEQLKVLLDLATQPLTEIEIEEEKD